MNLPVNQKRPSSKSAFKTFVEHEASGGYVLMIVAALALLLANSPLAPMYFAFLNTELGFASRAIHLRESVLYWINDGLMAVFFLLVGLEIKREILAGQLARLSKVVLPGAAAVGGVVLPALIYLVFNFSDPVARDGWAIPSATDIAFALGVLALLGNRVPASLKIFLTAIAIMDDLAAIIIITIFYTAQLHLAALAGAAVMVSLLVVLNRCRVVRLWPYLIIGFALWVLVLHSGIHATLAGVILALCIPLKTDKALNAAQSPLRHLEHWLHKPVAFFVVPLFGFANAGLSFAGTKLASLVEPVPIGIVLGLFVGKQLGIFLTAALIINLKLADIPKGASWRQLYGVSVLCGIGFTMSLFIGNLAFSDPALADITKLGVLLGSTLSALVGLAVLRFSRSQYKAIKQGAK